MALSTSLHPSTEDLVLRLQFLDHFIISNVPREIRAASWAATFDRQVDYTRDGLGCVTAVQPHDPSTEPIIWRWTKRLSHQQSNHEYIDDLLGDPLFERFGHRIIIDQMSSVLSDYYRPWPGAESTRDWAENVDETPFRLRRRFAVHVSTKKFWTLEHTIQRFSGAVALRVDRDSADRTPIPPKYVNEIVDEGRLRLLQIFGPSVEDLQALSSAIPSTVRRLDIGLGDGPIWNVGDSLELREFVGLKGLVNIEDLRIHRLNPWPEFYRFLADSCPDKLSTLELSFDVPHIPAEDDMRLLGVALPELKSLTLRCLDISDKPTGGTFSLSSIGHLPRLTHLTVLGYESLVDLECLPTSLTHLELSQLQGSWQALGKLSHLHTLKVNLHSPADAVMDLNHLSSSLRYLSIDSTEVAKVDGAPSSGLAALYISPRIDLTHKQLMRKRDILLKTTYNGDWTDDFSRAWALSEIKEIKTRLADLQVAIPPAYEDQHSEARTTYLGDLNKYRIHGSTIPQIRSPDHLSI
ncbi:uncharacterized protein PV07_12649 [Cladophialophora immunda]|uniref:Uncharacterized protein n=1 Tax=Cladophialophora immunda TaxID=569365 RepID=A0A0D2BU56_9EURO|nr:uncharacterized protein PV07_12649 [Cladophialophora immunda]KIW21945.1 hypothetical protein PV07_12649 [Cladophialophora immunda]